MRNKLMTVIAAIAVVSGVVISAPANAAGVSIAGKGSSFANASSNTTAALITLGSTLRYGNTSSTEYNNERQYVKVGCNNHNDNNTDLNKI